MKKSLQNTLFKSTIALLAVFIVCIIIVNLILSYNNFLNKKNQIKENIISSKKEIMKSRVDFLISNIENEKEKLKNKAKTSLKYRVDTAYKIATNLYNRHKNDENIEDIVVESLRELKFYDIGSQYVFMTRLDGTFLLVDALKHLEGKNVFDLTTKENKKTLRDVIKFVREKKSGFFEYEWQNHRTLEFEKKLSYFVYFEPFDCYIGTGLFIEDLDRKLKENFIEKINNYRFGEKFDNYVFAATYDGYSLTYPRKNEYIYDIKDTNGLKIVQELIKIAKEEGKGYLSYILPFGKDKKLEKISYIKGIDSWQLYIGTGETFADIDTLIQEKRKELLDELYSDLGMFLFFGIIFFILFYIMFRRIKLSINNDLDNLTQNIEKLVSKNTMIDRDTIVSSEFDKIAEHANKMLDIKTQMQTELKRKELILHQQSKMAAMGDMLENIAHQWRQPLSVITVATSGIQLKKQFDSLDNAYLDKTLNTIYENAKYLSTTIDDFRNFFLKDKETTKFKVDDVINTALKLIDLKFKKRDIEIIKNIESFEIENYKNELIQVVLIILNNAKDALEDIENSKLIFINIFQKDDFFYMDFKDSAKGISSENIEKVFEPYFTTKHQSKGTGIGLYMVQEIITKHMKGEILVENTSFKYKQNDYIGAKFSLKIPIKL